MKLGSIGTGAMGSAVVRHLLEAGHEVAAYNRTRAKADSLVTEGAVWANTSKAAAEQSNILFTMASYLRDVEEIYYGELGIFSADVSGRILAGLATSIPALAEKIAKIAREKGTDALNAPAPGGDLGAKDGALTITVGGEESVCNQVPSLFKEFGTTFTLYGPAGKGQHTKVANQTMIAGTMTGITEMLVYAQKNSLTLEKVVGTLSGGSAASWSLSNYSPRILKEDHTPGFFAKHFVKDLRIALEEAEKMNLVSPATIQALKLYEELADKGFENDGIQALIKLWWPGGKIPEKKS